LVEKQNEILSLNKTVLAVSNQELLLTNNLPWSNIFKAILSVLACYLIYQKIKSLLFIDIFDLLPKIPLLRNLVIKSEVIKFSDGFYDYLIEMRCGEILKVLIKELSSKDYTSISYYISKQITEKSSIDVNTVRSVTQFVEKAPIPDEVVQQTANALAALL